MAILQALLAFLGRSVSRIFDAVLGWAVVALFGRTAPSEKTLLTALVAVAAAWPLLVLGIPFPKIAAFAVALVPLHDRVAGWILRFVWIAAAILVPLVVGFVVNKRTRSAEIDAEASWKTILRGFPITIGIACAFALLVVTLPFLRLASLWRRERDEHLPLITDRASYDLAVARIDDVNDKHDLGLVHKPPPWWMAWPSAALAKLGGKAVLAFVPERLVYWCGVDKRGGRLELALYTSDLLIRGATTSAARAHALLAESFAAGPGLQTYGTDAQDIEREMHELWAVLVEDPRHTRSPRLRAILQEISGEIETADVEWEDWQVLYRKSLQLGRAIEGEEQTLEHTKAVISDQERARMRQMNSNNNSDLKVAPTGELLGELVKQTGDLVKAEMALARAEIKKDVRSELMMVVRGAIAGMLFLWTIDVLLAAAVLGLSVALPAWAAALIVAGGLLGLAIIAGLFAWTAKVGKPLQKTQRTLKDNVRWAKERLA